MAGELTIFDVALGEKRPATQEDVDRMQEFIMALSMQPEQRLVLDSDCPSSNFSFDLAIYPNRMRSDGVFVAESKEIEPYKGVTGLDGRPIYPSYPETGFRIGCQIPRPFAEELVRRWNAGPLVRPNDDRACPSPRPSPS